MRLEEFTRLAERMWEEVPAPLREGVEAVSVEEKALEHDYLEGVYTLGECVTDDYPSGYGGTGDVRSSVVLYYGSFRALAEREPGFDWASELWETLLHEILHHREAAAGESKLDDYDWAVEQNQRRHAGKTFDPTFYEVAPRAEDGTIRLDSEIFLDVEVPLKASQAAFEWRGRRYSVRIPPETPVFVEVANLAGGRLWLVVRRRRPWWRRLFAPARRAPVEMSLRALPAPAGEG